MTPDEVRAALLEAFKIDERLPGIGGPAGCGSGHPAIVLSIEEIAEIEGEWSQQQRLEDVTAEIIEEIRTGLKMSGEQDDYDKVAEMLCGRVPAPMWSRQQIEIEDGDDEETRAEKIEAIKLTSRHWDRDDVIRFLNERKGAKPRLARPERSEIDVMEERMEWLRLIPAESARILTASMIAARAGRSQRSLARRLGMSQVTLKWRVDSAIEKISVALFKSQRKAA